MDKKNAEDDSDIKGLSGVGGFFAGLGTLVDKLGDLAEKGQELRKTGEIHGPEGKVRGVYGFSIKTGIAGDRDVKIEPFGNVTEDEDTGSPVVHEVREPIVDVFDEKDHASGAEYLANRQTVYAARDRGSEKLTRVGEAILRSLDGLFLKSKI